MCTSFLYQMDTPKLAHCPPRYDFNETRCSLRGSLRLDNGSNSLGYPNNLSTLIPGATTNIRPKMQFKDALLSLRNNKLMHHPSSNRLPSYIPPSYNPHPHPIHISHPQTQLPTRRPRSHPIHTRMKLRNRRHSRNPLAPQLRQLLALCCVDIDEAVHVADAEALDVVLGVLLPLCSETGGFVSIYICGERGGREGRGGR